MPIANIQAQTERSFNALIGANDINLKISGDLTNGGAMPVEYVLHHSTEPAYFAE